MSQEDAPAQSDPAWTTSVSEQLSSLPAGEPSAPWADPLRHLLSDLANDARLTAFGVFLAREELGRYARTAAALDQSFGSQRPIDHPAIVIGGLPRTGTTLLQELLALDGDNRALRNWETYEPLPPLSGARASVTESQRHARERLAVFDRMAPEFRDIHPMSYDGPEECNALLAHTLASIQFPIMFKAPRYSEWLLGADLSPFYAAHAALLNGLPWPTGGERWVLKSPMHLLAYDVVEDLLPTGSLLVEIRRDPTVVIASWCSLVTNARRVFSGHRDPPAVLADEWADFWRRAIERRADSGVRMPYLTLEYNDLVRDPVASVSTIYARLDRPVTRTFERQMRMWIRGQDRDPRHRYDPTSCASRTKVQGFLTAANEVRLGAGRPRRRA
jgi:hypothetical protein